MRFQARGVVFNTNAEKVEKLSESLKVHAAKGVGIVSS